MGGLHIGKHKGSHVGSSSIALRSQKKALGMSLASTRSRGSNKRSFNIMSTRGSANKPFLFGEGKGSDAVRQSLRMSGGSKVVGQSLELRGQSQPLLASNRKPLP